jgi:hypothetical protein
MLNDRLPGTAVSSDLTLAVNRATSFVNTWAKDYLPFDDYQISPEAILAPAEVGDICLSAAEAYYFLEIGQRNRDGTERTFWNEFLYGTKTKGSKSSADDVPGLKSQLMEIRIEPEWQSQTISLNSDNVMLIGTRNSTTGAFEKIVPYLANITGTATDLQRNDEFVIRKGGFYDDEFYQAWYLDVDSGNSVTGGTLHYLRTYRKDAKDYADYKGL